MGGGGTGCNPTLIIGATETAVFHPAASSSVTVFSAAQQWRHCCTLYCDSEVSVTSTSRGAHHVSSDTLRVTTVTGCSSVTSLSLLHFSRGVQRIGRRLTLLNPSPPPPPSPFRLFLRSCLTYIAPKPCESKPRNRI